MLLGSTGEVRERLQQTKPWRAHSERAHRVASQLDAGAAWDGYHLYTYALDNGITEGRTKNGPWWVYFYGKPTDSTYVVSSTPLPGYVVISRRDYSSWLQSNPTRLFLLGRPGASPSRWHYGPWTSGSVSREDNSNR